MSRLLFSEGKLYSPSSRHYNFDTHCLWCIRSLEEHDDESQIPTYISRAALQIKVCIRTYRLFFVSGTEDFYWRTRTPANRDTVHRAAASRRTERKAALSAWLDGKIPLITSSNNAAASEQQPDHEMDGDAKPDAPQVPEPLGTVA